ncbi:hypothetical protein [Leeuwenhoekiella palythoae]|uniref:Uncharacterized protein n=1 Tax=Leeuwenhoekiella palythoae TaxID=573501 RepID=A0A1M5VKF4_9FLAO|nr:hypothetical protein [Leeuwenhoekiella palythoae]RXG30951.1 hypothetical protein DSM01_86 [Leeuwenhoekiella palythoae]SHH75711.1 hypothetical protein SAMN04487999_0793 [Leeuwenhoekiella palythoae]
MTENNQKIVVLSIIGLIILLLFLFQENKESSLSENQLTTIGKVVDIKMCGKPASGCITFAYLIDGKWIDGTDPESAAYPEFVREGKPEIGKYYKVVYDKTDINNSKILITKKPLTEKQTEKYLN